MCKGGREQTEARPTIHLRLRMNSVCKHVNRLVPLPVTYLLGCRAEGSRLNVGGFMQQLGASVGVRPHVDGTECLQEEQGLRHRGS